MDDARLFGAVAVGTDMGEPVVQASDGDEQIAERQALASAVAAARADPCGVPHDAMWEWLLKIAAGDFGAEAPEARLL